MKAGDELEGEGLSTPVVRARNGRESPMCAIKATAAVGTGALVCMCAMAMMTPAPGAGAQGPRVTYGYPQAPDEPGWDGAFQDPKRTKLLDGVAGGGAQYSVIWAATTEERLVDVDLGAEVALDRVVVRSYKHYAGRDFQLDHVRVYLSETGEPATWALVGSEHGYKLADERRVYDFAFSLPERPIRHIRVGVQNDDPVRLALSEIEVYARAHLDIPYTILANFEEVTHQPEGPPPTPTAAETKAGYVLFAPNYLRRIFPNSVPLPGERVDTLTVLAAPGEYEPLTVAVYPLRELGRCVARASDLVGPDGARIRAAQIEVRTVRQWRQIPGQKGASFARQYMVMPELLESSDTIEVKPATTRQWWITIRVPQEASPGEYVGTMRVEAERGEARELAVRLRVLPIRLQRPNDYNFGMYWGPWRSGREAATEEQVIAQLRDMREHGMNSAALSAPATMSRGANGQYEFDLALVTRMLELLQQEGFTRPIPWGYEFAPIGAAFGSPEHFAQVKAFVEHAREQFGARALPEVLWYPRDEPWTEERREQARVLCEAIKQVQAARTYITVQYDTAQYLDRWLDVRCHTVSLSGGFEAETVREAAAASGDVYWWYTNACREYPDVMRFKAGFFFWKTGATGQYYWAYQYPRGDPYNDLDGVDWCAAYPGDDGPIPTIEWEALREGIDDFRYVYTLEQAVAAARERGNEEARRAAAQAEALLEELRKDVVADLHEYERRGLNFHTDGIWPAERYDQWRRRVAEMIVTVNDAR